MISVSAIPASVLTCGRSCSAPNEQLSPIVSGRACRTACQKASTVWPDRLRPDRSVSVIDSMIGKSRPRSLRRLDRRHDPSLGVERIEHRLDQDEIHPALDQRVDLLAVHLLEVIEVDLAVAGIVDVGRERQRLVGRPERPGDEARAAVLRFELVGDSPREPARSRC